MLFDTMKTELQEKIRRLEEDRQNIDFNSGINEHQAQQCCVIIVFVVFEYEESEVHCWLILCPVTSEWSDDTRDERYKRKSLFGQSERKKKVTLVSGAPLFFSQVDPVFIAQVVSSS